MCTHAVEPVYSGHLGDRRKWLLQRGFKQESMYGFIVCWDEQIGRCREVAFSVQRFDCIPVHSEMPARLVLKYFLHLGLIVLILFDLRDSYSPTVHDHKL